MIDDADLDLALGLCLLDCLLSTSSLIFFLHFCLKNAWYLMFSDHQNNKTHSDVLLKNNPSLEGQNTLLP